MEATAKYQNIFDIRRFWKYVKFESWNIWKDGNYSLLCLAFSPVLATIVVSLFAFLFGFDFGMKHVSWVVFAISALIIIVFYPSKIYGKLTDKEKASDYLLLPASVTEKFLTMLLTCCITLPLFFGIGFFFSDWLLSVILGNDYGESVLSGIIDLNGQFKSGLITGGLDLKIGIPFALYLNWCENILIFTLGAIIFKKSKIAKTILACIALVSILTSLCFFIFGTTNIDESMIERMLENASIEKVSLWSNIIIYTIYVIVFAALDLCLYLRLKTIEH